jgi:hAT family C-terminal dimerisation region
MITLVNCAAYVGKYFDVLGWWMANNKLYPELAVRACLVLGKPTHNGFQERVFSRGTYQDTKLKKRLKEENFEMSVLNAINNRKVQNLQGMMDFGLESLLNEISDADKEMVQEQQAQEIHDFFQRGEDTEEEDGKPKADEISDDNDTDSVFSAFCENICLDGDDDDLSIAQMCQNLHLAVDDDASSFEFL